jgi:excisionase family DNA binding protein
METILTVEDVAQKLKMSKSAIYKMSENGKMPSFKIGTCRRFFEEEVIMFLHNITQEGKKE